jgi:acyl CoA:acetate/3-ketoacid CoA transferase
MALRLATGSKVCTAEEAAAMIPDGACVTVSGTITLLLPRTLLAALEARFLSEGHPRELTWFEPFPTGEPGIEPLSYPGLLKRVIGGWYTPHERLRQMILDDAVEAYLFPLGSLSFWCQAMAAGRDHYLTKVGLDTYLDPRRGGGKLNARTTEDIVSLATVGGGEHIVYPRLPIDVALIQASTVDEDGNVSLEDEAATMNVLYQALAAKRFAGRVIVQARRQVAIGQIPPRLIAVPGVLVDAVVIDPSEEREDSTGTMSFLMPAHRISRPPTRVLTSPQRKVWRRWLTEATVDESCPEWRPVTADVAIARRACLSLQPGAVVNVGAGLPLREIPPVAIEEGVESDVLLSVETGALGGLFNGAGFHANVAAFLDTPGIFSLYGSGLIGGAFFSMLEFDADGNVNLLRYGSTWVGPGGSMDIAEAVSEVVFCGTLRAGGLQVTGQDGRLVIDAEGRTPRAVSDIQGVCFNGERMRSQGKTVHYITERAVFRLNDDGIELREVAPGVDIDRDVLGQMAFVPKVASGLRTMDERIFRPGPMGLRHDWGLGPSPGQP